jgi:hypothetical protein
VSAQEVELERVVHRAPGRRRLPSSTRSSRRRRASARVASRNLRQAPVTSHAFGFRGVSSGKMRTASTSASCKASSTAAKSAPRRAGPDHAGRQAPQQGFRPLERSLRDGGRLGQERAHLEPLVDRLPTCPRGGRQPPGQLDGALVAVDVDHIPAGDEVLGLGGGAVSDRRATLAVVPDEPPSGASACPSTTSPVPSSRAAKSCMIWHVGRDLLRRPPVHGKVVHRSRGAR